MTTEEWDKITKGKEWQKHRSAALTAFKKFVKEIDASVKGTPMETALSNPISRMSAIQHQATIYGAMSSDLKMWPAWTVVIGVDCATNRIWVGGNLLGPIMYQYRETLRLLRSGIAQCRQAVLSQTSPKILFPIHHKYWKVRVKLLIRWNRIKYFLRRRPWRRSSKNSVSRE